MEQIAGLLRLRSVVGQVAVELDDLGGSLRDLVVDLVIGVFWRGNQKAKDDSGKRASSSLPSFTTPLESSPR